MPMIPLSRKKMAFSKMSGEHQHQAMENARAQFDQLQAKIRFAEAFDSEMWVAMCEALEAQKYQNLLQMSKEDIYTEQGRAKHSALTARNQQIEELLGWGVDFAHQVTKLQKELDKTKQVLSEYARNSNRGIGSLEDREDATDGRGHES